MLVEERPRRHDHDKRECRPPETDVERLIDILGEEADEEGDCANEREEAICEIICETLPFEVLIDD